MVKGISILSKTEILETENSILGLILLISIITISVGYLVLLIISGHSSKLAHNKFFIFINNKNYVIYFIVVCIVFLVCIFPDNQINIFKNKVHTGKYKYEITVSNYVKVNDLFAKYDFVDKKGDIYIVKDK